MLGSASSVISLASPHKMAAWGPGGACSALQAAKRVIPVSLPQPLETAWGGGQGNPRSGLGASGGHMS